MIYTSVSFVGSTALADELTLLGKRYATGVIVTCRSCLPSMAIRP